MKISEIQQITKKLWPARCLEDGDNDSTTRYLDGYCNGLQVFEKEMKKLIKMKEKRR